MSDKPETIGDAHPFNRVQAEYELEFDTRRFEYLVQRRDTLLDKIRFGALTLNGASLVGLLAALSGNGQAAAWLGFNAQIAAWSGALFAGGVLAAGLSIILEARRCTEETGRAVVRRHAASSYRAAFAQRLTPAAEETTERLMKEHHNSPLVDFGYSKAATWAQSTSTACWLTGIVLPIANAAGLLGS